MTIGKRLTVLAALLAACSGGGTGPSGGGIGTFTASIDGTAWVADAATLQVTGNQAVPGYQLILGTKLTGGQDYINMTLTLGYISGTGTYPLGVNQGTTAGGSGAVTIQQGGVLGLWNTGFSGSAGTVTITALTSTRMTGTFQFNAPPQQFSSSTGTRVVTNGTFDVPLGTGFSIPGPNNRGSKISATLGGVAWNGATVVGVGQGGSFSAGGTSTTYNVSLVTQTVVSAGNSYALGGTTGFGMTITQGSTSWGGPGSTGSVTITSVANGRAAGTFTGTLVRAGGGAALTVTGGTFDIRIDAP